MQDALSRRFSTTEYVASGNLVHWSAIKRHIRGVCDECAATLYESGQPASATTVGVPRQIRRVRDAKLYLCHPHALLWKDRDRDY